MSDELRAAIQQMKLYVDKNPNIPIYLHGGPREAAFAVLLPVSQDPTKPMANHTHLEGDEDE